MRSPYNRLQDHIHCGMVVCCSILIGLAEGDVLRDADVQRAALNVISNAVCGPSARVSIISNICINAEFIHQTDS